MVYCLTSLAGRFFEEGDIPLIKEIETALLFVAALPAKQQKFVAMMMSVCVKHADDRAMMTRAERDRRRKLDIDAAWRRLRWR